MSKHVGPFLAFDKKWFADHQRGLLWLLNAPVIGRWFRWCLCIRAHDVGHRRKILEIRPNCYTVDGEKPGTLTTDFRTHAKYAKRLYFAFRPLWWCLHWWDSLADAWLPEWSFGLSTLTVYPDPDPETTTVDGEVSRGAALQTWAGIRDGAGTGVNSNSASNTIAYLNAAATTDTWDDLRRGIALFDCSSLEAGASVTACVLSYYLNYKGTNLASPTYAIYESTPASNTGLVASDFAQIGTAAFSAEVSGSSLTASTYNDFIFNATGLAAIIQGVVKLGFRNANYDVANTPPTWQAPPNMNYEVNVYTADQAGTNNDPRLVVTYITGSGILPLNALRPNIFAPGVAR